MIIEIYSLFFLHFLDLEFTRNPRNRTVKVNERLRLRCRVSGSPLPHVVFLWNGRQLSEHDPGKIITSDKRCVFISFVPLSFTHVQVVDINIAIRFAKMLQLKLTSNHYLLRVCK